MGLDTLVPAAYVSGTGKSQLAIAVAAQAVKCRKRTRFYNVVDLVNQLELEKNAGATSATPR